MCSLWLSMTDGSERRASLFKGAQSVRARCSIPLLPSISSVVYILSLNVVKRVYIHTILINHFQTSIQSA
jgi:hypothetical protein